MKKKHTPEYWLTSLTDMRLPVVLGDLTVMDLRKMDPNKYSFARRVHSTPLCLTEGDIEIAQSPEEVTCKKCLKQMANPASAILMFAFEVSGHNVLVTSMRNKENNDGGVSSIQENEEFPPGTMGRTDGLTDDMGG